jgi:regulator of ribonuclease activity A
MNLKTSDLCDACDGARACALPFTSFGRRRAFSGDIRTVLYRDGFSLLRDMVHEPGAGKVLVIDGAGMMSGALFGDRMAELAVRNGWAGIVVNGLIRDRAEIDGMAIGVKALGTIPARADIQHPGERDVTVSFGGVSFVPGLRLVADEDGVIVLPPGINESKIDLSASLAATSVYAAGRQG